MEFQCFQVQPFTRPEKSYTTFNSNAGGVLLQSQTHRHAKISKLRKHVRLSVFILAKSSEDLVYPHIPHHPCPACSVELPGLMMFNHRSIHLYLLTTQLHNCSNSLDSVLCAILTMTVFKRQGRLEPPKSPSPKCSQPCNPRILLQKIFVQAAFF